MTERARPASRRLTALAATALLMLASVQPGCGRAPAVGGPGVASHGARRFVFPLPTEPATLNFVSGTDQSSVLVQRLVGDLLVEHDPDLRVVQRLAASWNLSDDGRVQVFKLSYGVRHRGGTLDIRVEGR